MKLRSLTNPVVSLGVAIALVGGTGVATAATGGSFILGRSNSATTQTFLTNPNGPALGLTSKAGTPPFTISNTVKVPRLNSDLLDGLDSTHLQRRVTGTCPGGAAVSAVSASGAVTCAALPAATTKISVSVPFGDTAVATLNGVTVTVNCQLVGGGTADATVNGFVYLTGGNHILNGHATTIASNGTATTSPVGVPVPAGGTSAKTPMVVAPSTEFARQSSLLMLASGTSLTQLTLHLFVDARDTSESAKACSLWGTAV